MTLLCSCPQTSTLSLNFLGLLNHRINHIFFLKLASSPQSRAVTLEASF